MPPNSFNDLTLIFESLVNWPRRLANEAPFYRHLFQRNAVQSVLDVACGTGHHANLFHSWSLNVHAADLSPNMIARATENFGQPPGLSFAVRSYTQPVSPPASFDAVVCVGNSLALVPDLTTVQAALSQMLAALRPGGLLILHVLNLWSLPEGPCNWHKSVPASLPTGPALLLKGIHRTHHHAHIELLAIPQNPDSPFQSASIPLLALDAPTLQESLRPHNLQSITLLGNYQSAPYLPHQSPDLIVVATK